METIALIYNPFGQLNWIQNQEPATYSNLIKLTRKTSKFFSSMKL